MKLLAKFNLILIALFGAGSAQTIPFYAATVTFDYLRKYSSKEAALNPSNLHDRAGR